MKDLRKILESGDIAHHENRIAVYQRDSKYLFQPIYSDHLTRIYTNKKSLSDANEIHAYLNETFKILSDPDSKKSLEERGYYSTPGSQNNQNVTSDISNPILSNILKELIDDQQQKYDQLPSESTSKPTENSLNILRIF